MNHSNESTMHHQQAWELLPWLLNGTASAEERRLVEHHLEQCRDCRAELALQQRLHAAMTQELVAAPDPERGLERLWQKIDNAPAAEAPVEPRTPAAPRRHKPVYRAALAAMLVLQAGVLAVLGAQFLMPHQASEAGAAYVTLSSQETGAARATIRIVPAANMRAGELGGLLRELDLQIVAGPTEAGVYSLAPLSAHGDTAAQLARLRASGGIRFAEPAGMPEGAR